MKIYEHTKKLLDSLSKIGIEVSGPSGYIYFNEMHTIDEIALNSKSIVEVEKKVIYFLEVETLEWFFEHQSECDESDFEMLKEIYIKFMKKHKFKAKKRIIKKFDEMIRRGRDI